MQQNGKLNLPPNHPKVLERVLERLRTMPMEELDAQLKRRPEGVEETFMNEQLAERSRVRRMNELKADQKSKAA